MDPSVFSGIIQEVNLHGTDLLTFFTVQTFGGINFNFEQGKPATHLLEHGNGTKIFTKSPIVLEQKRQRKTEQGIDQISHRQKRKEEIYLAKAGEILVLGVLGDFPREAVGWHGLV